MSSSRAGDQHLGHEAAAVGPEALLDPAAAPTRRPPPGAGAHPATASGSPAASPAASAKAAISSWSLIPGADSTRWRRRPRTGRAISIASATLLGVEPAGEDHRHASSAGSRDQLPVEALAGAAGRARAVGVEQVKVGAERLGRLDVGAAAHPQRLDHLAAGAPRRPRGRSPGPRRRAAGASPAARPRRPCAISSRVALTKTPTISSLRRSCGADLDRRRRVAAARALRPVVEPDRPGAERGPPRAASSSRVMPQNLTLIAPRLADRSGAGSAAGRRRSGIWRGSRVAPRLRVPSPVPARAGPPSSTRDRRAPRRRGAG